MQMQPELILVARPEAGLRATGPRLTAARADPDPLAAVLDQAGARLRPLFGASEERLRHEAEALAAAGPAPAGDGTGGEEAGTGKAAAGEAGGEEAGGERAGAEQTGTEEAGGEELPAPPDLSVYYRVEAAESQDLAALAARLREQEPVQGAYVKPPTALPLRLNAMAALADEPPVATPSFEARQGYLNAAPGGIEARWAWTRAGGEGAGVAVIDVEGAWRFTHEDLLQNQGGVVAGPQIPDLAWRNHGTAVLGQFSGDRNTRGVTGICPQAVARAVSIAALGSSGAIHLAANALRPGDLLLVELHRPGPRFGYQTRDDQLGYIAVEWWPDDYDAIRYAIRRGVVVVEAAGNGAEDLDDPLYDTPDAGFPAGWANPFRRRARDSGAVLVGAGAPPPGTHGADWGPDRSRLDFSNHGAAVDAQGWGREVTTTGYGDLQGGQSEDVWYTDSFGGTSSASPIVVGSVGSLQGAMRAVGRPPRTPFQARRLLRGTGTPQQDGPGAPAGQRIGARPNLRQLVAQATSTPGAAATSPNPGRFDVFVIGTDLALYQKALYGGAWHPSQSGGWTRLGGIVPEGPAAVLSPSPGRLEVFTVGTTHAIYHKSWDAGGWKPSQAGWVRLGDPVESAPVAVSRGMGLVDLFAVGPDRALYHKAWDGTAWQPSPAWERLGGRVVGVPAAASWAPDRLDLVALGPDRQVRHLAWGPTGWRPAWEPIGGTMEGGLAAVSWGPDRLDVFAVGTDRAVYHKAWDAGAWLPSQLGWERLPSLVEGAPVAVSWGPGRLDVFVVGTNKNLYHKALSATTGWAPAGTWERLGGNVLASPAAAARGPNRLDVVAVGTDRAVLHKAWDGAAWRPSSLTWTSLAGTVSY